MGQATDDEGSARSRRTGSWRVGGVEIHRVLENEFWVPEALLRVGDDPAALAARAGWAVPRHAADDGRVRFALATLALVSDGRRVLIDPCISLDVRKAGPDAPDIAASHLQALAGAGFPPAEVDLVVCTHLDGIGWVTVPGADGSGFEPAFPNARHVWTPAELARAEREALPEWEALQPLLAAGRVDATEAPADLTPHVRIEPAPGHTEGNVTVRIHSDGEEAVVVGDHILNPVQLADPDWGGLDFAPGDAARERRALLADCAARDVLVLGPHFASPGGLRVRADADADAYRGDDV